MRSFALALMGLLVALAPARAEPQWLTLPPTRTLPQTTQSGYAPVNGLHRGLGNANYWGKLVPALSPRYRVIVMDSRGHGRSSRDVLRFRIPTAQKTTKSQRWHRSDVGRDCPDAFLGLGKTCEKLGIAFWDYLGARLGITGQPDLLRLADLVRHRCESG